MESGREGLQLSVDARRRTYISKGAALGGELQEDAGREAEIIN